MTLRTLTCTTAMTLLLALGLAGSACAQTFTSLHSFDFTNGASPHAGGLVQAIDGDLYGTTPKGGANAAGTIFAISPTGMLSGLYSFCSQGRCADGANPLAGLVQATDGNLYGTTEAGGANGGGTIFKITPNGTLTTLYSFCAQNGCADGSSLIAGLVQATDGNFYGTTKSGGAYNYGTVFNITPAGTLTTLHSFDRTDGALPFAGLVEATTGGFYGTTKDGGAKGQGTVFRVAPSGTLTTLHSFDGTDGAYPCAALAQGTNGNFYGTTEAGGANGDGTIFSITPSGTLTTLYSFCSQNDCADGEEPEAPLVQATDGNFYGTTFGGGAYGEGTIFNMSPTGTLTTLHSFCSQFLCRDGGVPTAPLVQDTNGTFYGTTDVGGSNDYGIVFSLSVGLGPFVETLPTSGKVGASVKILGTDLTGATSVTFNGTSATFVIGSANGITTTVPAGATTGTVQVVTPSGALSSNVPFRVTQ